MHCYYPDYQFTNPLRSPAWRWERARALLRRGARADPRRDDAPTRRALAYLRRAAGAPPPPRAGRFADVHAARLLYDQGGERRWEAEARLLAGQPPAAVGRAVGLAP